MERSVENWAAMRPEIVAKGSEAQIVYALQDAKFDILELHDEVQTLRKINANLMGDDENVPRYTTKRLRLEIEKATDRFIAELNDVRSNT